MQVSEYMSEYVEAEAEYDLNPVGERSKVERKQCSLSTYPSALRDIPEPVQASELPLRLLCVNSVH
jgi:hypothetical protein